MIRSDGTFVRDYLYVEDGADAYIRTAEALAERSDLAGRAFNFSLEQPLTVLEMVDAISGCARHRPRSPDVRGEASNEIPAQYLDSRRAREGARVEAGSA